MTAEQKLAYAIDDLGCLPMSDRSKYDKINRLAARLKHLAPEHDKWARDLQPIVRDAYDRNPAEFLNWLYSRRGSGNHLAFVFSTIYTGGLEEKPPCSTISMPSTMPPPAPTWATWSTPGRRPTTTDERTR